MSFLPSGRTEYVDFFAATQQRPIRALHVLGHFYHFLGPMSSHIFGFPIIFKNASVLGGVRERAIWNSAPSLFAHGSLRRSFHLPAAAHSLLSPRLWRANFFLTLILILNFCSHMARSSFPFSPPFFSFISLFLHLVLQKHHGCCTISPYHAWGSLPSRCQFSRKINKNTPDNRYET